MKNPTATRVITNESAASRNITARVKPLPPLCREAKADRDKAESDDHVPCADSWNWILGLAYIEDDDPD